MKKHPHDLPHLNDAFKDGSVNNSEVLKGALAWAKAIENGEYRIDHAYEFAVNDTHDVLVIHRQKVK